MFSRLVERKNRFSHVSASSWHYKAVKEIWGDDTRGKACSYYVFKLTTSLLIGWPLMIALFVIVAVACCCGGLFFGYVPRYFPASSEEMKRYIEEKNRFYYPYRYLPNGKRIWVAPWMLIVPSVVGLYLYQNWETVLQGINNAPVFLWERVTEIPLVLLGLAFVFLIIFVVLMFVAMVLSLIAMTAQALRVDKAWDKVCPPLVVEPAKEREA